MQHTRTLEDLLNTQQKKLAFFQNLLLLAAADGELQEEESQFLIEVGNRIGLTAKEVAPLADNLAVLSFIVPADGPQKTLELQTLVQMMLQDGNMDAREYDLCLDYARRIGYSKQLLDDMVSQLSGNGPVPNNPPTVS
ncbi:TerB family tellurite resistance protein [Hymenobacter aerilatus]|uniref:TerB family tellurite resistance protein n=1 Tax=Hymenobacter aerilatus TaxID=2932251 RepID=A0A8T9SYG3_9BACT|nr:TerB family tellurite resistance protein [Hymenobacter aerilatus]UOR05773.1 TerB family tellurite resistance protein [Hymenobacter aerilatus]